MPIGTANAAMPLRATVTPVSRAVAVVTAMARTVVSKWPDVKIHFDVPRQTT